MNVWLLLLIAACAADVATTAAILKKGGRETWYLPSKLIKAIGMWPTLLGTKAVIIGAGVYFNHPAYYVVAAALNLAAAGWNLSRRN